MEYDDPEAFWGKSQRQCDINILLPLLYIGLPILACLNLWRVIHRVEQSVGWNQV